MSDPASCPHLAAHVHGMAGSGPRELPPEESTLALTPLEWGRLAGPLRPGERLETAIGECAACAALVVTVSTWHPDDGRGENAVQYRTRWTPLFSAHDQDTPAPADPVARAPLPATTVTLGSEEQTRSATNGHQNPDQAGAEPEMSVQEFGEGDRVLVPGVVKRVHDAFELTVEFEQGDQVRVYPDDADLRYDVSTAHPPR